MSQHDPMTAAASEAARKAGGLAAAAAAVIKLIIDMLREHQQREAAAGASASTAHQAGQAPGTDSAEQGQTAAARRASSVHSQVFASLPEPMARALVTSPQFGELATQLRRIEAGGADVQAFLSALAPGLARAAAEPAVQPPAPSTADRPGLRDRVRDALTRRRQAGIPASPGAWMSPDDQAWAVATVVYAAGPDAAEQLVTSPQWPQIAQDIATLGYGQQYGLTDVHPAQVLEHAWRALPGSAGVDWSTAAALSLAQARDQFARGEAPGAVRDEAPASGPDQGHQVEQDRPRAHDTQPVPVLPAQEHPAPQDGPAPDLPRRTLAAAAATTTSGAGQGLTPVFSDEAATDGATAVPPARVEAALARPTGVAQDAVVHVADRADTQQQAAAAPGQGHRQGR